MKNLFSKDEKITEKAFSQNLLISVLSILLCIVGLCSITYAWFSEDVESDGNILKSGSFDLVATVNQLNADNTVAGEISVAEDSNGVMTCTLADAGTYTVSLKIADEATVKGYCSILIGSDADAKISAPISKDASEGGATLTFKITTSSANTPLTFTPKWGYPASDDVVKSGATISVDDDGTVHVTNPT